MGSVVYEAEQVHRPELQLLRQCEMFRGLDEDELRRIGAASVHRVHRRASHLLEPGSDPDGLCLLVKGQARLYMTARAGRREIDLELLSAGNVVGLPMLCGRCSRQPWLEVTVDGKAVYHPLIPIRFDGCVKSEPGPRTHAGCR